MTDLEIYALENKYPTMRGIDSEADGLKYILCDEEKGKIAIAGQKGVTVLTVRQMTALCREVPGILRDYFRVNPEVLNL